MQIARRRFLPFRQQQPENGGIHHVHTLLANQSVLIHNLRNPEDKQELLTQETVELLTSPLELAGYKSAIMEAMFKGTKRNVESENDAKNAQVG